MESDVRRFCTSCHSMPLFDLPIVTTELTWFCDQCRKKFYVRHHFGLDRSIYDLDLKNVTISNQDCIGDLSDAYRPFLPSINNEFQLSPHVYSMTDFRVQQKKITVRLNYSCFPEKTPELHLTQNDTITIGDLHGNTLTLIVLLVQCGILMFRDSKDYTAQKAYTELANIIQCASDDMHVVSNSMSAVSDQLAKNLSEDDYKNFIKILEQNLRVIPGSPSIRLLGDLLAERRSNDALTLAVIGFLYRSPLQHAKNPKKSRISIIMSNHDNEFILGLIRMNAAGMQNIERDAITRRTNLSVFKFLYFFNFLSDEKIKKQIEIDIMAYVQSIMMFDLEMTYSSVNELNLVIYSHASFHPRVSLAAMKMLAYEEEIDGDYYPFSSKYSIADFYISEFQKLMQSANAHLRKMCIAMAQVGLHNKRSKEVKYYIDLFHDQSSFVWLALWLRLVDVFDIAQYYQDPAYAAYKKPVLHDLNIPQTTPFPILPPRGVQKVRNIHGHDNNARAGDISLNHYVGQGDLDTGNINVIVSTEVVGAIPSRAFSMIFEPID